MTPRPFFSCALAALLWLAATAGPDAAVAAETAADEVVARVGGVDLKAEDVRALLGSLPAGDQAALAKDPALLAQAVRQLLTRQLVLQEARAAKFDQQPDIKAELERTRDAALVALYLNTVARVPDGYPSDAEVQAAYDASKTAFLAPRQYKLAQIFVAAAKDDKAGEAKGKAKLDDVLAKLKAKGAEFAALARAASDANAATGGEIGWVAEPQITPEIRQAAAGLAKDGVSDPIRLDDGWHIVKLLDTKPAGPLALAEVRPALVERLRQARAEQARQAWLGELARKTPATINELALSKIAPKK